MLNQLNYTLVLKNLNTIVDPHARKTCNVFYVLNLFEIKKIEDNVLSYNIILRKY